MSKPLLSPQGEFPPVGLGRRLAAMFYDFLLCTALLIVTAGAYKMIQMTVIGEARMRELTDAGALDGDPLLSTILLFALFGFFCQVLDPWRADPGYAGMGRARAERRWQRNQPVAGAVTVYRVDCVVAVPGAGLLLVLDRQAQARLA